MENVQRKHPALQAGTPKNLIFNRQARRESEEQVLPIPDPTALEIAWRHWDDLSERVSIAGLPAELVALCGYKFCLTGSTFPVTICRRSVVVPVRDADGRIVSLHNARGEWFCARRLHFANLIRALWTKQIEIYADTVSADAEAIRRNVACVGMNGLTAHDLQLATAHLNVKLVIKDDWRLAA